MSHITTSVINTLVHQLLKSTDSELRKKEADMLKGDIHSNTYISHQMVIHECRQHLQERHPTDQHITLHYIQIHKYYGNTSEWPLGHNRILDVTIQSGR